MQGVNMARKTRATIVLAIGIGLALDSELSMAGVYKCKVDGKLVFSDTACVTGAEAVRIDPVPRDSLDNPETAERYRQYQEVQAKRKAQEALIRQREINRLMEEARQQQQETERRQHEMAVEQKLDQITEAIHRARRQAKRPKVCNTNAISYGSNNQFITGNTVCY
jgi:hypothetical protein